MRHCLLALAVLAASLSHAISAELPKLRDQCVDGVHDQFISAATLTLKDMTEHLPSTDADDNGERKAGPAKLIWVALPAGASATLESIAEYRGREIYRIVYAWKTENEQERRALLLAARDPVVGSPWSARPFFLANDEEVTSHEAKIVSTAAHPFTVKVEIGWRGSGHDWAKFEYLFDEHGAFLSRKQTAARDKPTKTIEYRGNKAVKTTVSKESDG